MRTHKSPDFAARLLKVLARSSKKNTLPLDFIAGCDGAIREIIDFETLDDFEVKGSRYDEIVAHLDTLTEMVSGEYHNGYKHVADLVRRYADAVRESVAE